MPKSTNTFTSGSSAEMHPLYTRKLDHAAIIGVLVSIVLLVLSSFPQAFDRFPIFQIKIVQNSMQSLAVIIAYTLAIRAIIVLQEQFRIQLIAIVAWIALLFSRILDITEEFDSLDHMFLIGNDSKWNSTIDSFFLVLSFILLPVALYMAVVESARSRKTLELKHAQLVLETNEREQLEKQLRLSQRMESVGLLAGGVAHDFNNLLMVILGYTELDIQSVPEDSELHHNMNEVLGAANRAKSLTQQLLAFSRRQVLEFQDINLNALIEDLFSTLKRLSTEKMKLRFEATQSNTTVHADVVQLEQILINLVANARDAMPDGGTIQIKTEQVRLDDEYCKIYTWATRGDYIMVEVSDTGIGMDNETIDHIFDPFYTLKEKTGGTGLGLSTVYGIVKQHNGLIHVYSEKGYGCVFRIYLPHTNKEVPQKTSQPQAIIKRGSGTILVAEDDESVRRLTERMLTNFGYTVLLANDGEEAVTLYKQHQKEIALVLLDIIMPNKDGREAYNDIRTITPDIPVIFCSGYSTSGIHTSFVLDEDINFLQKPYDPTALVSKINELIG